MSVWSYLSVEAPQDNIVRLRNLQGGTVIALQKHEGDEKTFDVISADGYKGVLHFGSSDGTPCLRGKMSEGKGYLKILLPVNGMTMTGKQKYPCREMLAIYYGSKERKLIFRYHLLLGDASNTSPNIQ
eukprot:m.36731 g.36731  ORF g.36731 m.36731 type:complete len:128 (+) comp10110_c0_seq1:379-762(+)